MLQASKQALVRFDGRDIPLDEAIAGDDNLLKMALLPHLGPQIAEAKIQREEKDGQMIVSLVKQAGPKGSVGGFAQLVEAPEQINPVFGLAWMLRWNDARGTMDFSQLYELQTIIEETLERGQEENKHTFRAAHQLKQAQALALPQKIILGF